MYVYALSTYDGLNGFHDMFTYIMGEAQAVRCRRHLDIDVAVGWVGKVWSRDQKSKSETREPHRHAKCQAGANRWTTAERAPIAPVNDRLNWNESCLVTFRRHCQLQYYDTEQTVATSSIGSANFGPATKEEGKCETGLEPEHERQRQAVIRYAQETKHAIILWREFEEGSMGSTRLQIGCTALRIRPRRHVQSGSCMPTHVNTSAVQEIPTNALCPIMVMNSLEDIDGCPSAADDDSVGGGILGRPLMHDCLLDPVNAAAIDTREEKIRERIACERIQLAVRVRRMMNASAVNNDRPMPALLIEAEEQACHLEGLCMAKHETWTCWKGESLQRYDDIGSHRGCALRALVMTRCVRGEGRRTIDRMVQAFRLKFQVLKPDTCHYEVSSQNSYRRWGPMVVGREEERNHPEGAGRPEMGTKAFIFVINCRAEFGDNLVQDTHVGDVGVSATTLRLDAGSSVRTGELLATGNDPSSLDICLIRKAWKREGCELKLLGQQAQHPVQGSMSETSGNLHHTEK
ncbi:hypothetical protein L210DRAFT_3633203 [Boletus edulis BED1]|uniref:Uncharacterized protein n=1 Tax=Boletus edulis BED1 TaxID=1328754 RepID=A0AAD4BL49_BOLED|nr:hypothetical protein L210DRAFT_3633203 [Boletus edulis BED1]